MELASLGREAGVGTPLDFLVFYLDDGVMCGSPQAVADALATLSLRAARVGLTLNLSKCELIARGRAPPGPGRFIPRRASL